MNDFFKGLFNRKPIEIIDGDYYFNTDSDGDQFDESDAKLWIDEGLFKNRWENAKQGNDPLFKAFYDDICKKFSNKPLPFLEIACGPGMGLTPILLSENPHISCIASDACSLLIKSWRTYINENLTQYDINLSSFSAFDMPFNDNSFDVITSFIGISSTRAGELGKIKASEEIYRVLKRDGYFIAIENEWTDFDAIRRVFELWGKPVWNGLQECESWQQKFTKCGFTIESHNKTFFRNLNKEDNELGEQADKFGINIGLNFGLYVLRKFID